MRDRWAGLPRRCPGEPIHAAPETRVATDGPRLDSLQEPQSGSSDDSAAATTPSRSGTSTRPTPRSPGTTGPTSNR